MASSGNNITGVHFSLIFFVMLSIILGVVSYLKINESAELRNGKAAQADKAQKVKNERDAADDEYTNFRKLVGSSYNVPRGKPGDKNTPISILNNDLNSYTDKPKNLKPALDQNLLALKKSKEDLKQEKERYTKDTEQLKSEKKAAEDTVASLQTSLSTEKKKVEDLEKKFEKDVKERDDLNTQLQADKRKLVSDMDTLKATHQEQVTKLEKAIKDLQSTVALKQQQIDDLRKVSFERPDGIIRAVDHTTKLVWINLGSEDRLPDRMTFSVYSQSHHGIARGRESIKGSIEITRITGAHMAEARILKNDLYDPIHSGDPIYTPLWSPGVKESFAFAGVIDLDGDGVGDRELLHRIVKAAGATISNEVDEKGVRHGTGITHNDKFLVVGIVPDPQATADPKEREIRMKMSKAFGAIEQEAKNKGVRKVRLADFLAYIGFKADRRLWRPGEQGKRILKAGAQSTAVNQTVGRRQSSGQTSGVYSKRGRIKQQQSSGQTSKLFGGYGR